jgi:subtilisin family serine protease
MVDYRARFDAELRDIHTSFLHLQSGNRERVYPHHSAALHGGPLSLLLWFGDDLAGIEARGFRTEWVEGDFARGDVELADLEAVASHPGVIRLEYGSRLKPMLDSSAKEINARGDDLTKAVWKVDKTGAFTGNRGAGVIIGVIDTGIDFRHPVFLDPGSTNTTRILRIWDMGIAPHDGIPSPDVSLIQGGFTYGVEYTGTMINQVLQTPKGQAPPKPVKHRDCFGHGTHVASIAAGDGRAAQAKATYQFVGVASAANLIIVKMFFLFEEPKRNGVPLTFERMIEDAITYVQRVAKKVIPNRDPPVVINASLGKEIGPHDGLSASETRIEAQFRNATKIALVAAAGNEADSRQHAIITMPASGTIDVPFMLYDERTLKVDKSHCDEKPRSNAAPELEIQFWYPQLAAQQKLTSVLIPPGGKPATNGPAVGGHVDGKYRKIWHFDINHDAETTQRPPSTQVIRNVLRIRVTPQDVGKEKLFGTGQFTLRLTAPAGTTIHAWGMQNFPPHGFRMGHDKPGSKTGEMIKPPIEVDVTDESTLSSPATSAGAIAVASYNDEDPQRALAGGSSQGPLVDYSGSGPPVAKPDLAAPGVNIQAAMSGQPALRELIKKLTGPMYVRLSGTSMATPHVAGVAALMFEKNPNLSRADLVQKLKAHARAAQPGDPPQLPEDFGAGRVDAKASRDAA